MRTIIAISLVVLSAISLVLIVIGVETHNINTGVILLALIISFLIFSFTILHQGEVGMMSVLGLPKANVGPGLHFTPAGIVKIRKVAGTMFQHELPADQEKIFRDDGIVPPGMFPPIRVKFGQPGPTEGLDVDPVDVRLKDDPYNVAMVTEVTPVVSWHVSDPITFFGSMGDIQNCENILSDKSIEMFGEEFSNVTPAKAMLTLSETSKKLEDMLKGETRTNNWGITINDAYVKPFIFTHTLNTAVIGVSIAQQNAKTKENEARGDAASIGINADAEKDRLIKTGLAKTDSNGNITELVPDANTRVSMEAIKKLSKVTGTLVLGQGITPVIDIQKKNIGGEK